MRSFRKSQLLWIPAAVLLPGLLTAQAEEPKGGANFAPSSSAIAPASQRPGYRIGFGDVLQIIVFKEPDASVPETAVRSDGRISVPFIGEVQVAGLTPDQLKETLTEKFKPYLRAPDVSILVKTVESEKVVVVGMVKKGGSIRLNSTMTVLEALSQAGLDPFAKENAIYVLRNDGNGQFKIPFHYKDVIQGKHTEQNILLKAGDTIVVP
jgi:polysaccharide export outer membrane protein